MATERIERRLAAILAADVAGYSRLVGQDEEGTLAALRVLRRELIDPAIAVHRGRIVKTTGDGLLVEFASVLDALHAAAAVQGEMAARNADTAPERRIEFRIGVHQGDIVVEDGDIFGDGVNVAARLEGIAEPGGICVSARVQKDATGRLDLAFEEHPFVSVSRRPHPVLWLAIDLWQQPHDDVRPAWYQPVQPAIGRHDCLPDLEAVAADRHGTYLGWCQIIINLPHPPGSRLDFRGTEGLNVHDQTDAASA